MSKTDLIKELRALTSAGMQDCKNALEETNYDLQKAVDVIKVKGLNIANDRVGKVAAEGKVVSFFTEIVHPLLQRIVGLLEVNCQTDFVSNSDDFNQFVKSVEDAYLSYLVGEANFKPSAVEALRQDLVAKTKENIVVRRWKSLSTKDPTVQFFNYTHSNNKIGVLLSMKASTEDVVKSPLLEALGNDLAMQVCAMVPLAVSPESLSQEEKDRQKTIFETQLQEEKKPEKMWEKIMEEKFKKWYQEVCLLEQESVVVPKTTVRQVIKNVSEQLGAELEVLEFVRFQVGEGLETKSDKLAEEVAKMMEGK